MELLEKIDHHEPLASGPDVDRYVARRLRDRRILFGLKQREVADLLGISAQQVHKYETGTSRISIGRLFELADILGVEIEFFFEGLGETRKFLDTSRMKDLAELARNFNAVQSIDHKIAICRMARMFAHEGNE